MKDVPYSAPDFSLKNADGSTVSLGDFAGQWLVVYFYPKDATPACTVEACSFRDAYDELAENGIAVVGISKDTVESHAKFAGKHKLPFGLLSDPDGSVIEAYGAWGKKAFGREGIQRKTFIIDPDGQVVKAYGRVTAAGHGQEVLDEIKLRQAASGAYGAGTFNA
ncbi:thioredoxin-dependent thiol peroxidase [Candidatus Saccharibacteria bacterium]|nr:MAG: thioredoxin-dependent thiol peroxidase [Candidatus Saccharibacteria bacterium]